MRRVLALCMCLCMLLSACGVPRQDSIRRQSDFDSFVDELFISYVTSDSLTLGYTLADPKACGIDTLPEGFPSFTYKDLTSESCQGENTLARLHEYDSSKQSFEKRILYDTLECALTYDEDQSQYLLYQSYFDPTSGIQAQLPVLLAEYSLEDKDDLEQYLAIIKSMPEYYESLLGIEQMKARAGTLPSSQTIKHTIKQCKEYVTGKGEEMVEESFENRLQKFSFLSDSEKEGYISRHKEALDTCLIPAYKSLIKGLRKLLRKAPSDGALAALPEGLEYYTYLLQRETGSDKSPAEVEETLLQTLTAAENELYQIAAKDPQVFMSCDDYVTSYMDADYTLQYLEEALADDFPAIDQPDSRICYVDSSLEDYLSPAFYLTPPVDTETTNVIYINESDKYDHTSFYNTLAHEAYPGHMYQYNYMRQKDMPMLRFVLDFPGYTEGYATYAEIYGYRYLDISDHEISILQNNAISTHCIYALCDIYIHYHHLNVTQLESFLENHGIYGEENARKIYDAIIDSPGSYLPYTVGYMEIMELQEEFKEKVGEAYTDKLFHQFLLDMGPTSYSVMRRYMEEWVLDHVSV